MGNEEFKVKLINKSFSFSLNLIKFVSSLPSTNIFKVISDQLLRSGFSIGANIAEGQGGSSKNDFKNFIHHAYKSSIETRYWLALIEKSKLVIDNKAIVELITEAKQLSKILGSILLTLKGKRILNS